MRDLLQTKVPITLPATLATQSFSTLTTYTAPVLAVQAAYTLGVAPTAIGVYSAIIYLVAMTAGLASGNIIGRYGAIRTGQVALLGCGLGLILFGGAATIWAAGIGAILLGLGTAMMNPMASHILARVTPVRWQPLVFSIKQTGTPFGGMLAGLMVPPLVAFYDWRVALIVIGCIPIATALLIQPIRSGLDGDRNPFQRIALSAVAETVRVVTMNRPLFTLAATAFFYTAAQLGVFSFTVIFLEQVHGLSKAVAGGIFAIMHGSAIPARIIWGMMAGRVVASWRLLGFLGLLMAAGIGAFAFSTPAWPLWSVIAVAVVMGCSMNGVLGLLLSEFARLAPPGRVGEATGGGQFFLFGGIMVGPLTFGGIVELTHSYSAALLTYAALTGLAGAFLLATVRLSRVPAR
ncbi:MAG: MFS transporter [Alphaproteobacteria bacterium]